MQVRVEAERGRSGLKIQVRFGRQERRLANVGLSH